MRPKRLRRQPFEDPMRHLVERYIRFLRHEAEKRRLIRLDRIDHEQVDRFIRLNLPLDPEKAAYGVAWFIRKQQHQPLHYRDVASSAQQYLPDAEEFCQRTKPVMAEAVLTGAEMQTKGFMVHAWLGGRGSENKRVAHAIDSGMHASGQSVYRTLCGETTWNTRPPDGLQKCQKCLEKVGPMIRGLA